MNLKDPLPLTPPDLVSRQTPSFVRTKGVSVCRVPALPDTTLALAGGRYIGGASGEGGILTRWVFVL